MYITLSIHALDDLEVGTIWDGGHGHRRYSKES